MKVRVPEKTDWVMDYYPRRRRARLRRFLRRPALWFWIGATLGSIMGGLLAVIILS